MWAYLHNYFHPDAFTRDPEAWVNNQLGHFTLGLISTYLASLFLPYGLVSLIIFLAYLGKELGDWFQNKDTADCLTDIAFVTCGIGFLSHPLIAIMIGAALLVHGITYRIRVVSKLPPTDIPIIIHQQDFIE